MEENSIFDKYAGAWDTEPRTNLAKAVFDAIKARVVIDKCMSVLDFGAGTGLLSIAISEYAGSVVALDTSQEMLRVLEMKCVEYGIHNLTVRFSDLLKEEHRGGEYDLVVSSMALHHVSDISLLITRLRDGLKKGGIFAVADLEEEDGSFHADNSGVYHFGFSERELIDVAGAAGFRNVQYETIHTLRKKGRDDIFHDYNIFLLTGKK